jgi:hypothetical protein
MRHETRYISGIVFCKRGFESYLFQAPLIATC